MHEGYSCEEFDARYHAGVAKLWKALDIPSIEGRNIRVPLTDVFEEAARQISDYHKLLARIIFKNGEPWSIL
jgi:predicted DNA-binding antitoxin AbrB/MazE fold protein